MLGFQSLDSIQWSQIIFFFPTVLVPIYFYRTAQQCRYYAMNNVKSDAYGIIKKDAQLYNLNYPFSLKKNPIHFNYLFLNQIHNLNTGYLSYYLYTLSFYLSITTFLNCRCLAMVIYIYTHTHEDHSFMDIYK